MEKNMEKKKNLPFTLFTSFDIYLPHITPSYKDI